jgi:hypothetical protein
MKSVKRTTEEKEVCTYGGLAKIYFFELESEGQAL